jgi:hypothetical protein
MVGHSSVKRDRGARKIAANGAGGQGADLRSVMQSGFNLMQ